MTDRSTSRPDPALDGVEVLTMDECLRLLRTVPLGRLVFHEGGLPAVRLVNFAVDDGAVVFRTSGGQKYAAVLRGGVVGFEVDDLDAATQQRWTVTIVGHASTITDPEELDRMAQLPLRPWASGSKPYLVRVEAETVRGRRLIPDPTTQPPAPPDNG